ncbi:hypothetical protein B1748_05245 [Paenibacillus sp. MY03]|jgi:putative aldouronate transport system substrate-binding protein|uniref:extracellular solute-binding protein n=1 Tax=Paenibacillus sp. MY03 TaxID=302980 RepID=UPI000B3CF6A9|nr:extracellular solute-binding protein [Paenibacillus sp. MY03]OUS78165.1 hypothetical protein B1748_05245 [Paenibacillus sp. MY03]
MNQTKKTWKRLSTSLVAFSLFSVALAGCSGGNAGSNVNETPSSSPSETASPDTSNPPAAGPLKFSITTQLNNAHPPVLDGNPIWEQFEKLTNTDITINFVPNANYADKFNLSLAGGDLTEVVMAPSKVIKATAFVNAARGGAFWDLTDELPKYPKIMKNMNDIILANTAIDGRTYGIPQPRPTARVGLLYRKDWFDQHGINVPTTMEEFYAAAKELKAKMPDVIPFSYADQTTESTWNGLDLFTVSQGGYNIWGLDDGKVTPYYETPEYMNVLNMFRDMYNEGLLNKDLAIVQGAQKKEAISTGKAAMFATAYGDIKSIQDAITKIDPNAEIGLLPVINGKTNATSGHNGLFVLPKSKVKTQEEVNAILSYFERVLEEDIILLSSYGIEGRTFNNVDGAPSFISPEAEAQFKENVAPIGGIIISSIVTRWKNDKPMDTMVKDAIEQYGPTAVANLSDPFVSPTYVEKGGELDKIVYDARVKYIMGELDENGYAAAIAEWRKQGGEKMIAEYTEEYNKANSQ